MTPLSRSALIEALAAGRPDDLLGTSESAWLDFKTAPYTIDIDRGAFELCKDVAAFANAQGGLLVCGVAAKKQSDRAIEIVDSFHPFPRDKVDFGRYIDKLNEYLRPRVAVTRHWYRDPGRSRPKEDLYYLVIDIEPVPEADRYVIVRRTLNDKGMLSEGLAVPVRHGDRTIYLPSEDAYHLINEGLRARDAPPEPPGPPIGGLDDEADMSLDDLEQLQDWDETPLLFWQSIPPNRVQVLPGLHSDDGIKGGLRHQHVLRSVGFNFEDTFGRLRVHKGGLFLSRPRCAVWVRPDGLMTAGAIATPDMLCWAMDQRNRPARLNVHVVTEMTLEYFRLADGLVTPRIPRTWRHRVVARRFGGEQPRQLGPGGTGPTLFLSDASPASVDAWSGSWAAVGDPERDAYEALQLVYALFGVDVASNPDVEGNRVPIRRFQGA